MPPDEITLREFMDLRFKALEKEFQQLREIITGDVRAIKERLDLVEDRLLNAENALKVYRYIGGLIVFAMSALAVAWLRSRLGI